jgi:hypothetical protein
MSIILQIILLSYIIFIIIILKLNTMNPIIIAIVILLKFLLPIIMIFFPFTAGWANFILDSIDGDILVPLGLANENYQLIDKIADYVTYICMVIWAYKNKAIIKRELLLVFILRSIGQFLFFFTRNELSLFFFPNLVEPLFLFFVTMIVFKGKDIAEKFYKKYLWIIWAIILIYKFQDEWFTHVSNLDRSDFLKSLFGL